MASILPAANSTSPYRAKLSAIASTPGGYLYRYEGVRNPGEHLIERRDIGENQLRQLAQRFLKDHGTTAPAAKPPVPLKRQQQFELT
ncbi:hypothetical protein [Stutzerimonas balearica]|uniref:hypothetical protein n=1 Tax=Stutzerimonas balearica TaxID=74829 RepID=UPI0028A8FC0C|nr:hypothetical protein [Stutzerimonas balearica]